MIQSLRLQNFITISTVECSFLDGFSVFTGESGAGKSVLFQALYGLLGQSLSSSLIRQGESMAELEGVFQLENGPVPEFLESLVDESGNLVIYRRLHVSKPALIQVNAKTVTLKTLKLIGQHLAICVGQHEQLALLNPAYQLRLLDSCIPEITSLMKDYTHVLSEYKTVMTQHTQCKAQTGDDGLVDFLRFQIHDIEQHGFSADEESDLKTMKKRFVLAEKQQQDHRDLTQALSQAQNALQQASGLCSKLDNCPDDLSLETIDRVLASVEELSFTCSRWDPGKSNREWSLSDIENRLDLIFKFTHHYKQPSLSGLLMHCESLKTKLHDIETQSERLNELDSALKEKRDTLQTLASSLSRHRKQQSGTLTTALQDMLLNLGFDYCQFEIFFETSPEFLSSGLDRVSFLISVNAGEPAKPLSKVSSGGELSRLLLAFYSAFSDHEPHKLLLCDEIDTGVGGLTANAIGQVLKDLGTGRQLFCITHLAQIVQFSAHHFVVKKTAIDGRTESRVSLVSDECRSSELSRLVGGEQVLHQLQHS